MHRATRPLFILLTVAFLTVQDASACSCARIDFCTRVEETPVIFLGEVIDGGLDAGQDPWFGTARFAKLRVVERFRGLPANAREVVIQLMFLPGMCSPMPYRKGERTLVFVGRDDAGNLSDGTCTQSSFAKDVPAELDYVRRYFRNETETTIRGRIAANTDWSGVDYVLDSNGGFAVVGARIIANGAGKRYVALSDSRGRYEISGIPSGSYSVRAELRGYTSREGDMAVEVRGKGCAIQDFGLWTSNSLEGSVIDSTGQSMSGLKVFLQKDGQTRKFGKESTTNAQGLFRFTHIDPGVHHLVVSPRGPNADSPFEKLDQGEAIQISHTAQLRGFVLRVPEPIPVRAMRLRLTWPDGEPVKDAHAMCAQYGAESNDYPRSERISVKAGVAVCTGLADRPYSIRLERLGPMPWEKVIEPREVAIQAGGADIEVHLQVGQKDYERMRQKRQ